MSTGTVRSVLCRPSVFFAVVILFGWGAMFNGCSVDKGENPAGGGFGALQPLDGEETYAVAAPQPLPAADEKENFHIYLAFGQSNMEGQNWSNGQLAYGSDVLPVSYKQNVNPRFQVMNAVAGSYKLASGTEQRAKGQWYKAVPPLIRNSLGLSPADFFGRVLVDSIKDTNIKVGVIAVAVAGTAIEGLEKGSGANTYFNSQQQFMKDIAKSYDNNPYNHLITLAKDAQKTGVIKGIIMHQGESGAASGNWAQKVKGIYDNMLIDLGLPPNSIPFLAGQAYYKDGNSSGNNNTTINTLTNTMTATLPSGDRVAHVISANGCTSGGDNLHFSYEGYKLLGQRYGQKMYELNYKNQPTTSIAPSTTR